MAESAVRDRVTDDRTVASGIGAAVIGGVVLALVGIAWGSPRSSCGGGSGRFRWRRGPFSRG
ncbi:hypothetical protein [Streptomyces prunicolor]|uniref:hypothetical protein n=1 Tax=Streptomyces prunicolor TaxID=67348 RepID=UPI0003652F08|nr:hypothetical protein [Streptomyces prunicolor]